MSEPLDPPETPEDWFRSAAAKACFDAAIRGYGFTKGGHHVPLQEIFVTKELPLYTCHKRVRALEIRSVGPQSMDANGNPRREVVFADPSFWPIYMHGDSFVRYQPEPGDYYVVYEDGYASFSPRKAFLDGYSLAQSESVLMERLNDLAQAKLGDPIPAWMADGYGNWGEPLSRVAREAYVTINSLKQQIERLQEQTTPRADGTAITDRIIEALQIDHYPGSAALNDLLRDCSAEITRLRADTTITRQMAGFKEVKREQKTDPDQPE